MLSHSVKAQHRGIYSKVPEGGKIPFFGVWGRATLKLVQISLFSSSLAGTDAKRNIGTDMYPFLQALPKGFAQ